VVGSGNILADMYTNVGAESTGRALATRLWELTDDPGMKDMLGCMIARDTMHQQQWLAVIEELGGYKSLPIPNSFPQLEKYSQYEYAFISPGTHEAEKTPDGRWTHGASLDGKGEFHVLKAEP